MGEGGLFFRPWIGADYRDWPTRSHENLTPPVHILGESHYGNPDEYRPEFTVNVVNDRDLQSRRGPFFSNLMKAWSGVPLAAIDRGQFWDGLAFSNYIQDFLPGPRLPPSETMWQRGHVAFEELLLTHQPDALLVLGQRLWRHMTKRGSFRLFPVEDEPDEKRRVVRIDDARLYEREVDGERRWTIAMHILHPSAPAFDLQAAQRRAFLMRSHYMNNIDTRGCFMPNDEARRIEITVPE